VFSSEAGGRSAPETLNCWQPQRVRDTAAVCQYIKQAGSNGVAQYQQEFLVEFWFTITPIFLNTPSCDLTYITRLCIK